MSIECKLIENIDSDIEIIEEKQDRPDREGSPNWPVIVNDNEHVEASYYIEKEQNGQVIKCYFNDNVQGKKWREVKAKLLSENKGYLIVDMKRELKVGPHLDGNLQFAINDYAITIKEKHDHGPDREWQK